MCGGSTDALADLALERASRLEACQQQCRQQHREQKVDGAVDYQRRRYSAGRRLVADDIENGDFEDPEPTRDMAQHAQGEGCGIDCSEGYKAYAGGWKQYPECGCCGEDIDRCQSELDQNDVHTGRREFNGAEPQRRPPHRAKKEKNRRQCQNGRRSRPQWYGRRAQQPPTSPARKTRPSAAIVASPMPKAIAIKNMTRAI